MSGDVCDRVTFEELVGGFFLLQRVALDRQGRRITGIEVIGHERRFGAGPGDRDPLLQHHR
jgi:hypothetical protein